MNPGVRGPGLRSKALLNATHIPAFEGDSRAVWFERNYQDYEADRHRRLGTYAGTGPTASSTAG